MMMHGVCSQGHMIRTLRVLRLQRLERQKGACHEKGNNHGDGYCFSRVLGDVFLLWSGYDQGGHCGHLHGTASAYTFDVLDGFKMVLNKANAKGGIFGKKLSL